MNRNWVTEFTARHATLLIPGSADGNPAAACGRTGGCQKKSEFRGTSGSDGSFESTVRISFTECHNLSRATRLVWPNELLQAIMFRLFVKLLLIKFVVVCVFLFLSLLSVSLSQDGKGSFQRIGNHTSTTSLQDLFQ